MPRGRPPKFKSALIGFSMPVSKDHENVSFRKIDNGYIVRHDGTKGGKHFEREFFSPKAPKLEVPKARNGDKNGDG
jgi:hypothetical protein